MGPQQRWRCLATGSKPAEGGGQVRGGSERLVPSLVGDGRSSHVPSSLKRPSTPFACRQQGNVVVCTAQPADFAGIRLMMSDVQKAVEEKVSAAERLEAATLQAVEAAERKRSELSVREARLAEREVGMHCPTLPSPLLSSFPSLPSPPLPLFSHLPSFCKTNHPVRHMPPFFCLRPVNCGFIFSRFWFAKGRGCCL